VRARAESLLFRCPLDVVKTRMMLGSKSASGELYSGAAPPPARRGPPTLAHRAPRPRGARPATGTLSSLRTIAAEEGAGALLKGIGPRVGWISIGGGLISRDEPR